MAGEGVEVAAAEAGEAGAVWYEEGEEEEELDKGSWDWLEDLAPVSAWKSASMRSSDCLSACKGRARQTERC